MVDKGLQAQRKLAPCVSFQSLVVHIVNPHVLLGATSERAFSALGRDGGSCYGADSFFWLALLH